MQFVVLITSLVDFMNVCWLLIASEFGPHDKKSIIQQFSVGIIFCCSLIAPSAMSNEQKYKYD